MRYMRPAAVAAATLAMSTAPLHAGGMAAPAMEPEVVAQEAAAASSGGFVVPLLFLIILAAVVSGGGSDVPRE